MPVVLDGKLKTVSDVVKNELWRAEGFCRTTVEVTASGDLALVVGDLVTAAGQPANTNGLDVAGIFIEDALGNPYANIADGESAQIVVLNKGAAIVVEGGLTYAGVPLDFATPAAGATAAAAALEAKFIKVSKDI